MRSSRFCSARRSFSYFFVPKGSAESDQRGTAIKLVDDVDEAIANIACIFHWPPSAYDDMDMTELSKWHQLALNRNQTV
ncbi:GpE family phage tail protein [Acinetobacter silvestris]|uniref:GpE family phage tail protein n=1 Tax=Acinetobacter silvestris TaxID=1977882 RepID=UPI00148A3171